MREVWPPCPARVPTSQPLTALGLGVLFGKLQQGVQENQQILTVARMRADAEELYGNSLAGIPSASERITGGFSRDEGASVRKVRCGTRNHGSPVQLTISRHTRACAPRWSQQPRTTRRLLQTSGNWL